MRYSAIYGIVTASLAVYAAQAQPGSERAPTVHGEICPRQLSPETGREMHPYDSITIHKVIKTAEGDAAEDIAPTSEDQGKERTTTWKLSDTENSYHVATCDYKRTLLQEMRRIPDATRYCRKVETIGDDDAPVRFFCVN